MSALFRLEMITPERRFFDGDVESIVVPSTDGLMGILKGHEPSVVAITVGTIKIKMDGEWMECTTTDGFIEIRFDETLIFAQAFEWPDEIDLNRALAAKERAEQRIMEKKSQEEYMYSKVALARAMVRLKTGRSKSGLGQ